MLTDCNQTTIASETTEATNLINIRHRVLIPINNTTHCTRAIERYFELIQQSNRNDHMIIFTHIIRPCTHRALLRLRIPQIPTLVGTQIQIDRNRVMDAKSLCRDWLERAISRGIPARAFVYVDSNPNAKLIQLIKSHKADAVVIWDTDRQGSRSEKYMMKHSPVSVVVVPA
ncbi:hypothetical protein FGIG_11682 [Fasciola gigantica]|uniref:UspA domain-containing protein n=1 Tax=Fasciola gigantica TaxID=46835 RepID=A0A504Z2H8_FASGI|nr:hypothetical protein FGIG_11682 [Fasciola gigantica]